MPIPTDPVILLTLDEASGTRADTSGFGNDATESGGTITGVPGLIDECASFVAADENTLHIATDASWGTDRSFTIGMWINPASLSDDNGILTLGNFLMNALMYPDGAIRFTWRGDTVVSEALVEGWNYIAFGCDFEEEEVFFFNQDGTKTTTVITNGAYGVADDLIIGENNFHQYFDGKIDQFRWYDYVLTQADFLALLGEATVEVEPPDLAMLFIGDSTWQGENPPDPPVTEQAGEILRYYGVDGAPRVTETLNVAVAGTNTQVWVPGEASFDNALAALLAVEMADGGQKIALINHGINENNSSYTDKATFKTRLMVIVDALWAEGIPTILVYSNYIVGDEENVAGNAQSDYNEGKDELLAAYPDRILAVEDTNYNTIQASGNLSDEFHPNKEGKRIQALAVAKTVYEALYAPDGGGAVAASGPFSMGLFEIRRVG